MANILHRDVSPNNLMWAPAGSGGTRVQQSRRAKQQGQPSEDIGYLIDLDFAAFVAARYRRAYWDRRCFPYSCTAVPRARPPPARIRLC